VFVVLAVVCCGGVGIFYYMVKPTFTEDPAEVRAKRVQERGRLVLGGGKFGWRICGVESRLMSQVGKLAPLGRNLA